MAAAAQTVQTEASPKLDAPAPSLRHLRGLFPYLARYRRALASGFSVLLLYNAIGALMPLAIGAMIDSLSGSRKLIDSMAALPGFLYDSLNAMYQPFESRTLLFYGAVLLGLVIVKGFLSFLTRWILIGVSRDIEYDLRNGILEKLLALDPAFYVRNRTGELMSRATNDLNNVRMVLGPGIMYSANTIVTMVVSVVLMLKLSPILTLFVLIPVPVVAFAVRYFGRVIHERYEKIQGLLASLSARVQENLAGVRVVRAYVQEVPETHDFERVHRDYMAKNLQLIRTWALFYPALEALIGVTFLIVLWQGGSQVLAGQISIGALMAFYTYMGLLVWPMIALGWVTNIFQRGAASMGRLNYILHTTPAISDDHADRALAAADRDVQVQERAYTPLRGEIEFRNLTFSYDNHGSARPVLHGINLRVPAGSTLAIVGPTGSGKSTLAALVPRLYDAPSGTVLIDNRPIREWPIQTLRRSIGYVPQDTFLFSETIRENIAFGVEDPEPGTVEGAAQVASLAADVADFPKKFESLVGERGITLSGGQKQRTSLARAVLRDPRILILDDALSSVDTETEDKILHRLTDIMRDRTTILISHRCSTVRDADLIIVLRDGRIVEQGMHTELIGRGGYYAELYQKQLLEEELERA